MCLKRLASALAVACWLFGADALAQRQRVKEFPTDPRSAEEMKAADTRGKRKMPTFTEQPEYQVQPEKPFDWRPIGFTILTFAIAAPFAWAFYKRAASEQDEINQAAKPARAKRRAKEE